MNNDKNVKLAQLEKEILACTICRGVGIGKMVFGEGDPDAKVMFIGEAPGRKEADTGRPFIGRSGQLLRAHIRDVGLREEEVYITSPVKYLPKKGTPSKKEIAHSLGHFHKQIAIINPHLLVLLGKTAVAATLQKDVPVLTRHGEIIEFDGRRALLTIHPAAVLRFPKYKSIFAEDFQKIRDLI